LLLVVLEGLTYREVAEVQGVPIGTVTSRLARARGAIKNFLEGGRQQKSKSHQRRRRRLGGGRLARLSGIRILR
jgi:transposase